MLQVQDKDSNTGLNEAEFATALEGMKDETCASRRVKTFCIGVSRHCCCHNAWGGEWRSCGCHGYAANTCNGAFRAGGSYHEAGPWGASGGGYRAGPYGAGGYQYHTGWVQ